MSYCPKCGNKIDEEMTFCPKCGASLKEAQAPVDAEGRQYRYRRRDEKSEKNEKNEKNEKDERREKHEKGQYGFIGPLIGGLVLIFIGLATYLQITQGIDSNLLWAFFFVIIGIIVIIGGIFGGLAASRRHPKP